MRNHNHLTNCESKFVQNLYLGHIFLSHREVMKSQQQDMMPGNRCRTKFPGKQGK